MNDSLDGFLQEPPHRYEFEVVMRGYARRPVRDLFDRVEKTLNGTADELERVSPDVVRAATFDVVLRGYRREQVHAALLDCVQRLQAQG
uniref:DivIVA domain-containing protein n=1 Tax=Nonomuraea pusilla TaxID=46177 RepID=UPI0006E43C8F|nr:DivIVA domain-containing protein [Nonomuraea pusilla]